MSWYSFLSDWRAEVADRIEMRSRHPAWGDLRNTHIAEHTTCLACGKKGQQVHHGDPVKKSPERELDPTNLYTYCRNCHNQVGHFGDFAAHNPEHAQLARVSLNLRATYREKSRGGLVPAEGVVYRTALELLEEEHGQAMTPHVQKCFGAVRRFVENRYKQNE